MPAVHAERRGRLAAKAAAEGADAVLITNLVNVRYLTGLASSNAALLVPAADGRGAGGPPVETGPAGPLLATDSRYALAAERDAPDVEMAVSRRIEAALAGEAVRRGYRRLLFEAHEVTVERYQAIGTVLAGHSAGAQEHAADSAAPATPGGNGAPVSGGPASGAPASGDAGGPVLAPLGRFVEKMREVKDDEELALLRTACQLSCRALEEVLPRVRPGLTERQLAAALEQTMTELGAERPAFDTIVASGPNGAIPHHVPTGRPLERGDLVVIDFGARYGGYHADMTRTVSLGEPAAWQREVYQLVAAAQRAGTAAARPGAELAAVDAAARDLIADAGHGRHFQHGLGHGVGLEVHEEPLIAAGRTGTLGDRVPVTIEPGVYLPGKGGVRIEDTLAVRAGATELLTTFSKDLLVL